MYVYIMYIPLSCGVYYTATHCNTPNTYLVTNHLFPRSHFNILLHNATHCNILQNTRHISCHEPPLPACAFDTLQHTASNCKTLQHTATHCNTLHHTAALCSTLQHNTTNCSTLQHTARLCHTLPRTATHCNTLQHAATHCNTLQHIAKHCSALLHNDKYEHEHKYYCD